MKKRILAGALSLVMLFSLMPASVLAAENDVPDSAPASACAQLEDCGGGVHGDRGIVTVHRIALARTGEFGPAVRQQAGQGALQGGGSPFPGLAAHVHPGNGGVGQESAAARIGAKPYISTR